VIVTASADASAADPRTGLVLSKLRPPAVRPGLIRRAALLDRLVRPDGPLLVSVVAPGGYGKTTLLGQWAAECGRAFAWVTVDRDDNDAVLLAREIEAALRSSGAVGSGGRAAISSSLLVRTAVNRLRAMVSASTVPFVLVLDDVHELTSVETLDFLRELGRSMPEGSQLVLAGRSELPAVVAAARTSRDVLELDAADLALTDAEAHALLERVSPATPSERADEYVRSAEGWAAGLYLLALAAPGDGPGGPGHPDRFVSDYLWSQHLASLPGEQLPFLLRSSVLDRMSGDLCDSALGRTGSARMLDELEGASLFLVPLDAEREWYRYHDLFRAVLLHELERREPGAATRIAGRAADWCLANGLPESAMLYAAAAGDTDRMARIFVPGGFALFRRGQSATLIAWLERFDDRELLARYPGVAALGAIVHALHGRAFQAERWLDVAANAVRGAPATNDQVTGGVIAAASALLCRHGPARMCEDAEEALALLDPFHPLYGPALAFRAIALHLARDPAAEAALETALEATESTGATFAGTTVTAELALLALDRGDVARAQRLCGVFRAAAADAAFVDYPVLALPLAADARTQCAAGAEEEALRLLAAAQRLRPALSHATPHLAVFALVEMARAYLELQDPAAARAVLFDAARILEYRPDVGFLGGEVERLREQAAGAFAVEGGWESSLTAAELRLLPYLPTHLSFREIGERLFVSRNTVKTQAISIYRKLDATSRGEAVARAEVLGLLDADLRGRRGNHPEGTM
jgi:LuxR family maltose regulon positive regulatory protein